MSVNVTVSDRSLIVVPSGPWTAGGLTRRLSRVSSGWQSTLSQDLGWGASRTTSRGPGRGDRRWRDRLRGATTVCAVAESLDVLIAARAAQAAASAPDDRRKPRAARWGDGGRALGVRRWAVISASAMEARQPLLTCRSSGFLKVPARQAQRRSTAAVPAPLAAVAVPRRAVAPSAVAVSTSLHRDVGRWRVRVVVVDLKRLTGERAVHEFSEPWHQRTAPTPIREPLQRAGWRRRGFHHTPADGFSAWPPNCFRIAESSLSP